MGFEVTRVRGEVDEELICPICSFVLEDPVLAPECEHFFCRGCISTWLDRQPTCPVDRKSVTIPQLRPAPRLLKNLLSRLDIACENASHGCESVLKLDLLESHLKECAHNPKRPVACESGCGITVPKDEMKSHNCVRELRSKTTEYYNKVIDLSNELSDCKYQLAEQRREISLMKDLLIRNGMHLGGSVANMSGMTQANYDYSPLRTNRRRTFGSGVGRNLSNTSAIGASGGSSSLSLGAQALPSLSTITGGGSSNSNRTDASRSSAINATDSQQVESSSQGATASTSQGNNSSSTNPTDNSIIQQQSSVVDSANEENGGAVPRTVTNQIQDGEVVRWAGTLPRARVTRWGGMISTPDCVLQTMIKRALIDSGCPEYIVDELMANAHERRWPPGLLTLETRQMNRRQYEQYVCKRIPNKQAVVVMACDNMHMSDDMLLEPGLVMIFAHGIE